MRTNMTWMIRALAVAAAVVGVGCSGHDASPVDGTGGPSGSSGSGVNNGGSSGSSGHASESEALFKAPTGTATPDSIFGVWGGTTKDNGVTFDTRMKLSATSATLATRCTLDDTGAVSGIVGVTAAARVSAESLVILESKSDKKDDGVVKCGVNATPREVKRCGADQDRGFERNCFRLEGTSFTDFGATPFDKIELTKLSD